MDDTNYYLYASCGKAGYFFCLSVNLKEKNFYNLVLTSSIHIRSLLPTWAEEIPQTKKRKLPKTISHTKLKKSVPCHKLRPKCNLNRDNAKRPCKPHHI